MIDDASNGRHTALTNRLSGKSKIRKITATDIGNMTDALSK